MSFSADEPTWQRKSFDENTRPFLVIYLFWGHVFYNSQNNFLEVLCNKAFCFRFQKSSFKVGSPHSPQVDILVIFTNSINASPNLSARGQSSVSAFRPQIRCPFWFVLAPAQKAEDQWYITAIITHLGGYLWLFTKNPLSSNVNTRVIILLHQAGFDPLR